MNIGRPFAAVRCGPKHRKAGPVTITVIDPKTALIVIDLQEDPVLWGFFNPAVGYMLTCRVGEFNLRSTEDVIALELGTLLMAQLKARMFGRPHGGNSPGETSEAR
jgi:hypothetical protein